MKKVIYTILISVIILTVSLTVSYGEIKFGNEQNTSYLGKNKAEPSIDGELLGTDGWEQIPGPFGGIVQSIANWRDTLFAGTIGGGIYKSTNFGDDWTFIGAGLPFKDIQKFYFTMADCLFQTGNTVFIILMMTELIGRQPTTVLKIFR